MTGASSPVMLVVRSFPTHDEGEDEVGNLALKLSQDHKVRVIVATSGDTDRGRSQRTVQQGLIVYRLPGAGKFGAAVAANGWYRGIRWIIREEQVGLVNAHAAGPALTGMALRAAGSIPFVLTYRSDPAPTTRRFVDRARPGYEALITARLAAQAERIICPSEYVQATLLRRFGPRTRIVRPAVDTGVFVPGGRPRGGRVLFVGAAGQPLPSGDLTDLLQGLVVLRRRVPGVVLEIIGDSDECRACTTQVDSLGLSDIVEFSGRLQGKDLVAAYQRATVVALPTRSGSLPTPLLQAMACARPVVSSRIGEISGLVQEGVSGLLHRPGAILVSCVVFGVSSR